MVILMFEIKRRLKSKVPSIFSFDPFGIRFLFGFNPYNIDYGNHDMVEFNKFNKRYMFIRNGEFIKIINQNRFQVFHRNLERYKDCPSSLLFSNGQEWKTKRKLVDSFLSGKTFNEDIVFHYEGRYDINPIIWEFSMKNARDLFFPSLELKDLHIVIDKIESEVKNRSQAPHSKLIFNKHPEVFQLPSTFDGVDYTVVAAFLLEAVANLQRITMFLAKYPEWQERIYREGASSNVLKTAFIQEVF